MNKVIYRKNETPRHYSFTYGKIYDVIEYDKKNNTISILDDKGEKSICYLYEDGTDWFEDATAEIRDNKLNELGI